MEAFICVACGVQHAPSDAPPQRCAICEDPRQFVPESGQAWTTMDALRTGHANEIRDDAGVTGIGTAPWFAIGQRALLVPWGDTNLLWDCVTLLDPATEDLVRALGGLHAIAISHPHFYTVMQDWAAAFGAPIWLHAADREWVVRPDPAIRSWDGDGQAVAPGVTLVRLGGHFAGGTVLHWTDGADGAGVVLAGDILAVTPGADRVSFQWSYPNMMPLPAGAIRRLMARLEPWRYGRLYGAFAGQDVLADAGVIVARSAARYIGLLEGS